MSQRNLEKYLDNDHDYKHTITRGTKQSSDWRRQRGGGRESLLKRVSGRSPLWENDG